MSDNFLTGNSIADWSTAHPLLTSGAATVVAVVAGAVAFRNIRATTGGVGAVRRHKFSAGTLAAVVAFCVCTSVSLNTSYRFTSDGLGMVGQVERLMSCAAFESLIAMCVLGARERMAGPTRSPGWYGSAVWIFAAISSVPAWHEGGGFTTGTLVRIIVGSFGSALSAHAALGLDVKHRTGEASQTPLAMIARELRERLMARMGLAQRGRTAEKIAKDRALSEAVDLGDAYERMSPADKQGKDGAKVAKKLARALDLAGCADDPAQKERYRSRVALRLYGTDLGLTPEKDSPWRHTTGTQQEAEEAAAELEARVRHMEELAAAAEAAIAAHAEPGEIFGEPVQPLHACQDIGAGADDADEAADCINGQGPGGTEEDAEHEDGVPEPSGQAAAAHGQSGRRVVTAHLPPPEQEEQPEPSEEAPERGQAPDLMSYPTKKAALEALYHHRISADDPRTNNAIAEELLSELARAGRPLDRGAANRYLGDLRPPPQKQPDRELTATGA